MTEADTRALRATTPPVRVFLESRYRKLVRDLPQTIFWCPECKGNWRRRKECQKCEGFGKLTRDSVQELLARHLLPAFKAKEGKFHGAGREDVDVRMLGSGRPFVFEIVGARRRDPDLVQLRETILEHCKDRIEIEPFVAAPRARIAFWKEAKLDKVYRALVTTPSPFDAERLRAQEGRHVLLRQRTPQRVAHRRADLEREREVTVEAITVVSPSEFELRLRCAHGTYVKEWISGDDGRTTPSLPELLGVPARCAELDVLEIVTSGAS